MHEKNKIHILIIFAGMICTLIPLFHHNLWFDEAYSVGMAAHTWKEIYAIGIHDVHPLLYYDILHVVSLPFSDRILAERIFSWLVLSLLAFSGYRLISRNYDERSGFFFAFLILFMPCNMAYAGEIRMYTLVMFFVTMAAFYGDMIMHGEDRLSCRMFFALFCICAAYTHYYGLLAAAVMNIILFFADMHHRSIRKWLGPAAVEIGCYLPWISVLIRQTSAVQQNFWVEWHWPQSLFDLLLFIFTGNLDDAVFLPEWLGILLGIIFLICLVMAFRHGWRGQFYLMTWSGVIFVSAAASLLLHRVIVYPRYLLVIQGCLILFIALNISLIPKKRSLALLLVTACCSGITFFNLLRDNYDPQNNLVKNEVKAELKPGDIILLSNTGQNAGSFAFLKELGIENALYYNSCGWSSESILAYRALGNFKVVDEKDIADTYGRIWYISCADSEKYTARYEDQALLNHLFSASPSLSFEAEGRYKGFYYAAYLYQHAH